MILYSLNSGSELFRVLVKKNGYQIKLSSRLVWVFSPNQLILLYNSNWTLRFIFVTIQIANQISKVYLFPIIFKRVKQNGKN